MTPNPDFKVTVLFKASVFKTVHFILFIYLDSSINVPLMCGPSAIAKPLVPVRTVEPTLYN